MNRARMSLPRWTAIALSALLVSSCGGTNYFAPASNKNSDDAIFEDVTKLADKKQWDAALTRMGDLSSSFRDSVRSIRMEAGIHAGKCGLDFLQFASGLDGSGSSVFSLFMSGFTSVTVSVSECQTAQTLIETKLGATAVDRAANLDAQTANNVNFFMAVLGAAKIGAQLRAVADTNQDGAVDGGFDACRAAAKMTPSQIVQVGTGFSLLVTNFSTIAASFGGNSGSIDDISAACSGLSPNPCAITDPANSMWTDPPPIPLVEPVAITAFRSLVQSSDFGIGSCASGSGGYPFDCCVP